MWRCGNWQELSSGHVAFRDRPFHRGTLLPEGEQKESNSQRGDFGKPHRGQLPSSLRWQPGFGGFLARIPAGALQQAVVDDIAVVVNIATNAAVRSVSLRWLTERFARGMTMSGR